MLPLCFARSLYTPTSCLQKSVQDRAAAWLHALHTVLKEGVRDDLRELWRDECG